MDLFEGVRGTLGSWVAVLKRWGYTQTLNPSDIRPLVCVRVALGLFTLGSVVQSEAHVSYVNRLSNFTPSDAISWEAMGREGTILFNPSVWKSKGGLRFRISKPSSGSMRLEEQILDDGKVLCVNTTNSGTVHLEFDQPVSAAAAQIVLSHPGNATFTMRAYDSRGSVLLQSGEAIVPSLSIPSKYMGALANGDQIKSMDFSTDNGTIQVGRIDLLTSSASQPQAKPLSPRDSEVPVVLDQSFTTVKNGAILSNAAVSAGARNIAKFVLVKAPTHASFFQLFADGVFAYRPEPNFSGTDSFLFAGLCADGTTQSLPACATVNVSWANTPPSFKGGRDQVVTEDSGRQSIAHWATMMTAGSPEEDRKQHLSWIVNTDQPLLFLEQPSISADGTLTYAPAPHAAGIAHVTAWLKDDGGVLNGGSDTSTPYEFTITFSAVTHRPILSDLPEQTLQEGQTLNIRATASSVDLGKVVVYSLENAPQGMTIDPLSGVLIWTPKATQIPGLYDVTIRASIAGQEGFSDRRSLRIDALRHASGPVLQQIASRTARVGEPVAFRVNAQSATAPLQYLLGTSNSQATLDTKTGEFSWKPGPEDAGRNHTFLVSAFDPQTGSSSNVSVFTVAVEAPSSANQATTILPASTTSTAVQTMRIVGISEPIPAHSARAHRNHSSKTHKPVRSRTSAARHRRQTRRHVH